MACEGVQMFIDAAQRSLPSFTLAEDDLEHVERILNAVQGMPLGILLAAAWIDMMPIHEIADEITDSLDFLETEMGNIPDAIGAYAPSSSIRGGYSATPSGTCSPSCPCSRADFSVMPPGPWPGPRFGIWRTS